MDLGTQNTFSWKSRPPSPGRRDEPKKYYVLGTQYDITAKAKAFAEYKINDIAGQDDNYVVGLQYNF